MSNLSLDELLASGLSVEDILLHKEPVEVKVTVDTDDLANEVNKANKANSQLFSAVGKILEHNNNSNRLLLSKLVEAIGDIQINSEPSESNITGLKIIRNEMNLMTDIKFIRE